MTRERFIRVPKDEKAMERNRFQVWQHNLWD